MSTSTPSLSQKIAFNTAEQRSTPPARRPFPVPVSDRRRFALGLLVPLLLLHHQQAQLALEGIELGRAGSRGRGSAIGWSRLMVPGR